MKEVTHYLCYFLSYLAPFLLGCLCVWLAYARRARRENQRILALLARAIQRHCLAEEIAKRKGAGNHER